jgi:hypothetical protein
MFDRLLKIKSHQASETLVFPQFLRHISQRSLMSAFELKGTDLI